MKVLDFSKSFLTFRIDSMKKIPETVTHEPPFSLNNARIQLECRLHMTDKLSGNQEQFVLGASCKTERVGVERDIWTQPNADFAPIFSSRQYAHIKTYHQVGCQVPLYPPERGMQTDRPTGLIESAFDSVRIDLVHSQGELLEATDRIIQATFDNEPMVAVTEIDTDRYIAVLEYPIKTMNANERDNTFQTDTGPVLLPDLARDWDEMIEGLDLAFSAFNCPDWTEFIVRQATPLDDGMTVWHYSRPKRFDAKNRVFRLVEDTPQQ